MGAAALDLPMPSWPGAKAPKQAAPSIETAMPAENSYVAPVLPSSALPQAQTGELAAKEEEMPQGAAAAELAAAAKPRRQPGREMAVLPAPLLTAGSGSSLLASGEDFSASFLPQPEPLGQPLAKAGVVLPEDREKQEQKEDASIWNALNLKSLPAPLLGNAQAAALDMPVPETPKAASPFTPAEQAAPLSAQSRSLPDAPSLAAPIPPAVGADGAPLPPRQPASGSQVYDLPKSGGQTYPAPAPNIASQPSALNPNVKAQELARQQQDILMLRQQMDQRLKELQTAEDKMKNMLKEAQSVEDKKIKALIQMYANMKPRTAAQALENMDERVASRILAGMAPKQSGEILTYTNPVKTAKFTEILTRMRMAE